MVPMMMASFNPRPPHGERQGIKDISVMAGKFQSAPPARGATRLRVGNWARRHVSIRAPRTGSDIQGSLFRGRIGRFNPRPPHGERHAAWIC